MKTKKTLAVILSVIMLLSSAPLGGFIGLDLPSFKANAEEFDGLKFTITNGEVKIIKCNTSKSGELIVPEIINGYPVTSIGYYAFEDCTNLSCIIIPDTVASIGSHAFENCKSLKKVTIPDSVTNIANDAFYNCVSLRSIMIPNSVKSIGSFAFLSTSIKDFFYKGTKEQWAAIDNKATYYSTQRIHYNVSDINNHGVFVKTVAPTCTEIGYDMYACFCDSGYYNVNYKPATGHNYVDDICTGCMKSSEGYSAYFIHPGETISFSSTLTRTLEPVWRTEKDGIVQFGKSTLTTITIGGNVRYTYGISVTGLNIGQTKISLCDNGTGTVIDTVVVRVVNHEFSNVSTVAPTCTDKGYTLHMCNCGEFYKSDIVEATGHHYKTSNVLPTCTEQGYVFHECSCGDSYKSDYVDMLGHDWKPMTMFYIDSPTSAHGYNDGPFAGDCLLNRYLEYECTRCNRVYDVFFPPIGHTNETVTQKATLTDNGKIETKCTVCGEEAPANTIYHPDKFTLSSTKYTYTGKEIKPTVTVKDSKGKTVSSSNYTASYSENINAGTGKVTIKFKGNYSGTKTVNFTITPKQVTGLKVSDEKTTSLKLTWSKTGGAKYYKVEQSTDGKKWKTLTTTDKTSYTVKSLKAGTKYHFRVTALDSTKKIVGKASSVLKTGTLTSAPTLTLKSTKSKTATASWKKVTGAKKYVVYKSTNGKKWSKVTTTTKTSYNLTKLTGGKKIYVRVTALNAYSKASAYSSIKSVTVKK